MDLAVDTSDGVYDETGWAPRGARLLLGYQRAWFYDRSPMKLIAKSRQIGITWTTALEAVEVAATRRSAGVEGCGMDVYFMTTSRDDARKFIDDCADWIRVITPLIEDMIEVHELRSLEDVNKGAIEFEVDGDDWFDEEDGDKILAFRIDFPSGFSIYALPSRPARLRGKSRAYAIIDEAAQQDLEAVMTAAGGLLIWKGRLAFISTYLGTENGFYRLVEAIKTGEQKGSLHEVDIHQALAEGLYQRICNTSGEAWSEEAEREWLEWLRDYYGKHRFKQECECIPERGGSSFIPRALVSRCQTLGERECTILEVKGGTHPRMWIDGDLVEESMSSWEVDDDEDVDEADPDARAVELKRWLDTHLSAVLESINADNLPVFSGLDYGRTINLSSWAFAVRRRDRRRRVRLWVELENLGWPEQDMIGDYIWDRISLEAGCADGNGNGSNSAERANRRSRGRVQIVKITAKWHGPQFEKLEKRFQQLAFQLPHHFAPLADDLVSVFRGANNKFQAPQRTTRDDRKQKRHADAAYALALLEQAVDSEGPSPPAAKKPRRGRKPRRRKPRRR